MITLSREISTTTIFWCLGVINTMPPYYKQVISLGAQFIDIAYIPCLTKFKEQVQFTQPLTQF